MFIGLFIGIIMYILTISQYLIRINVKTINLIKFMTKSIINLPKKLAKKGGNIKLK